MAKGGKRVRIALIYPNTSSVGLSNLGAFIVHQMLLRHPMVEAHMLFWEEGPDPSPRIVNSSGRAMDLKYFDAIAFSVSFENDLLNLPQILDSYSIPIYSRERNTSHPLVIMGGVVSFSNPEPVSDFVDLFLLGEAEAFFQGFLDHMAQSYFGLSREEFLLEIQRSFSYAYVPSLYEVEEGSGGTIRGITPKDP
ncbi:MAG: radical SAM protein, partial [Desulfatiglandales bacterium]